MLKYAIALIDVILLAAASDVCWWRVRTTAMRVSLARA